MATSPEIVKDDSSVKDILAPRLESTGDLEDFVILRISKAQTSLANNEKESTSPSRTDTDADKSNAIKERYVSKVSGESTTTSETLDSTESERPSVADNTDAEDNKETGDNDDSGHVNDADDVDDADEKKDTESNDDSGHINATFHSTIPPSAAPLPISELEEFNDTAIPLQTPIPLTERVLSGESIAHSVISSTTVAAGNVAKEELQHDESNTTDDEDSGAEKEPVSSWHRHCIFCGVIVVLFLASAASILFGTDAYERILEKNLRGADSREPSPTPVTGIPTIAPTPSPTSDSLLGILGPFSGYLLEDPSSPQFQAYRWMKENDNIIGDKENRVVRIQARYALLTMHTALLGQIPSFAADDECDWPTVTCQEGDMVGRIAEVKMARQLLTGRIPPEISLLRNSLVYLDLAENQYLKGSIPDDLFSLTNLKFLYLHDNALSGTISEKIGNLQLLEDLYLGNNQLSGKIPYNLGSRQGIRPLRRLILRENQLAGTFPANMALSNAVYVDFSFNKLNGTLPEEFGTNFTSLRYLYLDHNLFKSSIPESYGMAGNGSLAALYLNNNMLTGGIPSTWTNSDNKDATPFINTIDVRNNSLTDGVDDALCNLGVSSGGSLVSLGADCEICWCQDYCSSCWG